LSSVLDTGFRKVNTALLGKATRRKLQTIEIDPSLLRVSLARTISRNAAYI